MITGKLSRRRFVQSSLAAVIVASVGVPMFDSDLGNLEKIVQSFPLALLTQSDNPLRMTFFLHVGKMVEGHLGLQCSNAVVDCTKPYDLNPFLDEDFTELTFENPRPSVSAIVSGANRIAKQTRRGRGNHYAVMSDHILVWYKGQNIYDTPVQRVGANLAYGPNFKDYFVRVRGVSLTRKDHNILETLGYERVA